MRNQTLNPMTCTITLDRICSLVRAQAKSAQLWIDIFERHKDPPSIRNAALAIGKVGGIMNILYAQGVDLPEDLIEIQNKMTKVWDKLGE